MSVCPHIYWRRVKTGCADGVARCLEGIKSFKDILQLQQEKTTTFNQPECLSTFMLLCFVRIESVPDF
jgi:hypothetical protein